MVLLFLFFPFSTLGLGKGFRQTQDYTLVTTGLLVSSCRTPSRSGPQTSLSRCMARSSRSGKMHFGATGAAEKDARKHTSSPTRGPHPRLSSLASYPSTIPGASKAVVQGPLRCHPPPGWAPGPLSPRRTGEGGKGNRCRGQAVTLRQSRAAGLPAPLRGAHVQLSDRRAPSSSSSACSSSSSTSSTSSASASASSRAAASAGRPDCRAAAVVAARLDAARLLGPTQRPAL